MQLTAEVIKSLYWLENMNVEYYYSTVPINRLDEITDNTNKLPINESLNSKKQTKLSSTSNNHMNDHDKNSVVNQARILADSAKDLVHLKSLLLNFDGCSLKINATNTVFADGNPSSDIILIGEAPGANEDLQGIPFCGESGKLLDAMLKAIGLSRQNNVYITNTIFWRPPANRTPTVEEIEICKPFLEKHIALINPKLIIMVGSTAANSLLGSNIAVSKIKLEYYSYQNKYLSAPILSTAIFHPAYLLRQPMQKKATWYDLLKIKQHINI